MYRNPFVGCGLSDDDLAVADIAVRTGAWARDEAPAPYPLAEGCQDHLIALAIEESLATGAAVRTTTEAWAGLTQGGRPAPTRTGHRAPAQPVYCTNTFV